MRSACFSFRIRSRIWREPIGSTPATKYRGDPAIFGRLVEDHDRLFRRKRRPIQTAQRIGQRSSRGRDGATGDDPMVPTLQVFDDLDAEIRIVFDEQDVHL